VLWGAHSIVLSFTIKELWPGDRVQRGTACSAVVVTGTEEPLQADDGEEHENEVQEDQDVSEAVQGFDKRVHLFSETWNSFHSF